MASGKVRKPRNQGGVAAYAREQEPAVGAMCERLRELIEAALPKASSKVWHGSPVWFLDENPVVGYSAKKKGVSLLFWNGKAIGEPALEPVGKYGAAEALFGDAAGIDAKAVRRWLKVAGENVFDSKAFFKEMRARK
ncbi:MAG TPA: DUF1801 domain-containing protein [Planctomycetota bacterium]|nr:DUF1801 domain-containing protein [Planctomycetota bacterium]